MKRPAPDLAYEPDPDVVAEKAFAIAERVRDDDPATVFRELVALCELHPAKAAQIIITLGAWFNPDETVETLWGRVEAISASVLRIPA